MRVGVNEFGHDKGFSTTFGGKRYFAEWHNPAQHCSPVLMWVGKTRWRALVKTKGNYIYYTKTKTIGVYA